MTPARRGAKLGEPPLLAELREHRHRPLAEQRVGVARRDDTGGDGGGGAALCGQHVLRPQRVAVALVTTREAGLEKRVERSAQRLAAHVEPALQLDEARAAALAEQRQRGGRPAVVKELDQFLC